MGGELLNIDFGKIVTNALSALVATVFVGAAVIVWNEATSIDKKIEAANGEIQTQQIKLEATQTTVVEEIAGLKQRIKILESQAKSLSKVLAQAERTKGLVVFKSNEPFVLDEFKTQLPPDIYKKLEISRINKEIDIRQQKLIPQKR